MRLLFFFPTPFYHRITVRGCPHLTRQKMVLCSHLEYLIATTGVHDYSISPCQTPFWNLSLAVRTRRWTAPELSKNGVLTRTHRPCTRMLALCPNACLGTWSLDVFTLVSSKYRTRAPCPGTRCEPCLRFLMCSCFFFQACEFMYIVIWYKRRVAAFEDISLWLLYQASE